MNLRGNQGPWLPALRRAPAVGLFVLLALLGHDVAMAGGVLAISHPAPLPVSGFSPRTPTAPAGPGDVAAADIDAAPWSSCAGVACPVLGTCGVGHPASPASGHDFAAASGSAARPPGALDAPRAGSVGGPPASSPRTRRAMLQVFLI